PTAISGLSAVMGSWNTIAMSPPRTPSSSRSGSCSKSPRPASSARPVTRASPASRSSASAVTVLPEPDSPTRASFSPGCTSKPTPCTTCLLPKRTSRSRTRSSGPVASPLRKELRTSSAPRLARIERIAQRIAHEGEQQQRRDQHAEGGQRDPPRIDVVLALAEQLAQAGRARRHPQAKEVQRGQRQDRRPHPKGQEGDDRRHAVGQDEIGRAHV